MRASKVIHVVSCHAEGEVGDVIVGGVAPPPGDTLWAQSRFIHNDKTLRDFVLNEPRGGVFRHVNLLVPPKDPRAAMGWIIMEPEHTPPMSGSNSMCVATVLLETGIVEMKEPETRLVLEAPGGLIEARARCRDGKVERVTITNHPSFADRLDATIEVAGLGTLTVDTAYGGDSFVLVDAGAAGFALTPDEAHDITLTGMKITRAANEQLGFRHPQNDGLEPHLLLPVHRSGARRGRRAQRPQHRGDRAGQARPLALRHRLLGAHGGAACQGAAQGRRPLHRHLHHRQPLRLPHRARDRDRRAPGHRARRSRAAPG